jgi:putative ABC transport system substrate-binding protein
MPVIGYLCPESPGPFANRLKAFTKDSAAKPLRRRRDVAIDYQWAEGQYKRLPWLRSGRRNVDVIVAAAALRGARGFFASKTIVLGWWRPSRWRGGQLIAVGNITRFRLERGSVPEAA